MALPYEQVLEYVKNAPKCHLSGEIISVQISELKGESCFRDGEIFVKNINSEIFKIPFSENLNICTFDTNYSVFQDGHFSKNPPKNFSEIIDLKNAGIFGVKPDDFSEYQISECNLENFWKFSVKIEDIPARNFFKNENILNISIGVIFIFAVIFLLYKKFFKK